MHDVIANVIAEAILSMCAAVLSIAMSLLLGRGIRKRYAVVIGIAVAMIIITDSVMRGTLADALWVVAHPVPTTTCHLIGVEEGWGRYGNAATLYCEEGDYFIVRDAHSHAVRLCNQHPAVLEITYLPYTHMVVGYETR